MRLITDNDSSLRSGKIFSCDETEQIRKPKIEREKVIFSYHLVRRESRLTIAAILPVRKTSSLISGAIATDINQLLKQLLDLAGDLGSLWRVEDVR